MITKRSDALDKVEQYKKIIDCLVEKPARLTFGKHNLEITVSGIELVKATGFKNAPDKQVDENGKKRTPMMFAIKTYDGDLIFLFDHTNVAVINNGVRFIMDEEIVDLRLE